MNEWSRYLTEYCETDFTIFTNLSAKAFMVFILITKV